jgi:hypothetical protein
MAIENEEIEVLEISFSDAFKMIETEEIVDARTIVRLEYAQFKGVYSKY